MSHSFTNLLYHIVFATKERHPWLVDDLQADLYAYMGGIVRQERGIPIIINGMPDHVHLLVKLHQDCAVASFLRTLKAGSSSWLHKHDESLKAFAWQTGYGAFTVSLSQEKKVHEYIAKQKEHHRTLTFTDEMRKLLRAHGIDVDESVLWE